MVKIINERTQIPLQMQKGKQPTMRRRSKKKLERQTKS